MGMCDQTDADNLTAFRSKHYDLWLTFLKDDLEMTEQEYENKFY